MPLLADATALYVGDTPVTKAYLGDTLVWEPPSSEWTPDKIPSLTVWHTAEDYTPGSWPNRGSGPDPAFIGSPAPPISVNTLGGLPLVRFKANEGALRGTGMLPSGTTSDLTVIYLTRMLGPTLGRIFTNPYPPINFLVGAHVSGEPQMYDNGWVGNNYAYTGLPTPWRMYGAICTWTPRESSFWLDGVWRATSPLSNGHASEYNLSGYGVTEETCDCEVAELLCYDRVLSEPEWIQVHDYLRAKWLDPLAWMDSDARAYLTATGLDPSYASALDGLVVGLKDKGLWSKMSAIYPFIGGTADLHKWNLKDPRDADAAYRLTFDGGAHSLAEGYRPNYVGSSYGGKANSHLVPLGLLDQNSTHMSMYSLLTVPPADRCEMGVYTWEGGAERFNLIANYNGDAYYYGMSERGATNTPMASSSGLFVTTRTAPDNQAAYHNGTLAGSSTAPSIPLPPHQVAVGGLTNYAQGPSNLPFGFASIGAGLTAQNVTDLYTVVQDYQTALGRQRSPLE